MKPPKQPQGPSAKNQPENQPDAPLRPRKRPAAARPRIDDDGPEGEADGNRIAKVLARAGLCSRRDAERWIAEGRVAVNGTVLTSPAFNVGPKDRVTVDGEPLPERERTRLWLYHKPRGLVTTARDPEGRPTVFANLPEHLPRVIAVGRLDINTEGLLLLTNDGGLARVLELPSTGWLRRYRARAWGEVMQPDLDRLRDGVTIDGMMYGAIDAALERVQGSNVWINLALREGKNREVKNVLANLGLDVNRLIRISYGPFQLGDLAEGEVVEIRGRILRDQLGEKLAIEAGVDFDAPVRQGEKDEPAPRPARPARKPAAPQGSAPADAPRQRRSPAKPAAEPAEETPRRRGRPISDRRRLAYERTEKEEAARAAAPAEKREQRRFVEASGDADEASKGGRPVRRPSRGAAKPAYRAEGRPGGKPGGKRSPAAGGRPDARSGDAEAAAGDRRGAAGKPSANKTSAGKPWAGKPSGGKPSGGKRPSGERPSRGPASERPDGDRPKPRGPGGGRGADRRR